jgi:hypothetical protein
LFSCQMSPKQFVCTLRRNPASVNLFPTQIALWNQNLAGSADHAIVWDYHVVLILRLRSDQAVEDCTVPESDIQAWIYDYDTLLPKPCLWKGASPMSDISYQTLKTKRVLSADYVSMTFRTDEAVPPQYRRLAFPNIIRPK